ncbi:hypothetical protein [Biformimicrobium ophioploci]|uniref:SPOR domain-containing protein n=1 Tax=Biformimicrobium ophioploci TaxID=3036711 RepID=A0ABQ6M2U2_9GAMM|nr:hypothetical protein [Microbulbifer sp. NKW57]GMG88660.1 SPOR domain-containing protein [Microbulbifer sp. NKW57]
MRWIALILLVANIGLFFWLGKQPAEKSSAAEKPLAVQGAAIEMLSELPPERVREVRRQPARQAPPPQALCTMLGPVAEESDEALLDERFRALGLAAEVRDIEMQGAMRYWVYLEPLPNRKEAFRRLRELQAAGVDSYVIPKGSLTNGISFGIFAEEARASSLQKELQDKGYPALFRQEPQTYTERWVVVADDAAAGEDFWRQIAEDFPDLERRQNLCSEQ